jgi:hypothetical protein
MTMKTFKDWPAGCSTHQKKRSICERFIDPLLRPAGLLI